MRFIFIIIIIVTVFPLILISVTLCINDMLNFKLILLRVLIRPIALIRLFSLLIVCGRLTARNR